LGVFDFELNHAPEIGQAGGSQFKKNSKYVEKPKVYDVSGGRARHRLPVLVAKHGCVVPDWSVQRRHGRTE
jgi:hypothetical protein